MLNLIGEGIEQGAKKALSKATKEAGEEVAEKAAKTVAKKATRAEVLGNMAKELKEKYGDVAARKIGSYYGDGKMNATLGRILRGEETQGPLLMYHATSAEKLADLAKLGKKYGNKMPNPSLQIVDPNVNIGGNFGDVILLGNKDMAYPKGKYGGLDYNGKTNIYGRDIYSKRKPFVKQLEDGEYYFYPNEDRIGGGLSNYNVTELATPENLSKQMNKPPVRGSEGMTGPGPVAAMATPQFKSLSDVIEGAKVGRLQSKDAAKKATDEWTDRVFDAIDEMRRAQDVDVHISNTDYMRAIQELLGNKRAVASGFEILPKDGYDIFKNPTARAELSKLAEEAKWLPTDYFELKANRPINMSEFSGAILPEDFGTRSWDTAEQEVMKYLEDNGIPIVDRYFVGADGSSEKSKEAIFKKLTKQDRLKTPYLLGLATLLGGGAIMGSNKKEKN